MQTIARLHIDTFELTLCDIKQVDPRLLHALSVSVGWQHRESDWQMLLALGQGLAAVDEIGRVVGTVMWLRYDSDFAMICMLITLPRLQEQGAGRWLMEKAHELNKGAVFGLNATREAKRLYRSLGYAYEQKFFRCQGEVTLETKAPGTAAAPAMVEGLVRPLVAADHDRILQLDKAATGHDRSTAFQALLPASQGQVLVCHDDIVAFALCRPFGRGHVIGPIVAASETDAIAVSHPHVEAHAGRFLRVDTPASDTVFTNFLVRNGLQIHDSATSMGLGQAPYRPLLPHGPRRIALASQALG